MPYMRKWVGPCLEGFKFCSQCGNHRPLMDFCKDSKRVDEKSLICRDCNRENRINSRKTCKDCDNLCDKGSVRCVNCAPLVRRGESNPQYKTGKTLDGKGYVILSGKQGHPNANKRGKLREHIFVMTEYLGRPISSGETVHHLGAKDDNRIEMLQLRQKAHGNGQAFECADCNSDRYDRDHEQCLQCMDCKSYRIKPVMLKGD